MEYTAQFRSLVIELGNSAPDDDTLVFLYRQHLNYPIRRQLMLAHPQPTLLTDAEALAERAEAAERTAGSERRPQHKPQFNRPSNRQGPVPMEVDAV